METLMVLRFELNFLFAFVFHKETHVKESKN